MVRANNGTTVEHIQQTEINDIFKAENIEQDFVRYITYPRSMEISEMSVADGEFPILEFEVFNQRQ